LPPGRNRADLGRESGLGYAGRADPPGGDRSSFALAAFDHKQEALEEFNREVALVPKAVKPGSPEWSTAYWHRAMIYSQMGQNEKADKLPDGPAKQSHLKRARDHESSAHSNDWRDSNLHAPK